MLSWLASGIAVILVDQLSKALVRRWLADSGCFQLATSLRLRCTANSQANWGLSLSPPLLLFLWFSTSFCLVLLVLSGLFFSNALAQVALGAAWGGATSNFLERIWRGAITDFVDFGFWPVFNLADVAIVAGATSAILFFR